MQAGEKKGREEDVPIQGTRYTEPSLEEGGLAGTGRGSCSGHGVPINVYSWSEHEKAINLQHIYLTILFNRH